MASKPELIVSNDVAACDYSDPPSPSSSSDAPDTGPPMYRRPSGIAYGTERPSLLLPVPELHLDSGSAQPHLSRAERAQSRAAEASILRDNHLLPPKHGVVEKGRLRKLYDTVFSTKVRDGREYSPGPSSRAKAPRHSINESTGLLDARASAGHYGTSGDADETAVADDDDNQEEDTLLPASSDPGSPDVEEIGEQWEAAVQAGSLQSTWQREAKTVLQYSLPLTGTFLLQYSINVASVFAVGRLGKEELGAVSIANMTAVISCYSVFIGLSTSLDTLCSQAYGSGHKHLVGLQCQRMAYFLLLLFLPIAMFWWYGGAALAYVVPEAETAQLAGQYLRILIIGGPAAAIWEAGKRFVQSQGIFHATTYILLVVAPLNICLNYLFVWHLGWGFIGAPISIVITQNMLPIMLFLYIYFIDGRQCWGGFSRRALANWLPMIKLAIPGLIMLEAEYVAFELLVFAATQLGPYDLAAQGVVATLTSTTYQIPFSISVAGSMRVANLIGAKLVQPAKMAAKVTIAVECFVAFLNFVVLLAFRHQIPYLLTQDPKVAQISTDTMPVLATMQIADAMAAGAHGLLRGIGQQHIGSYTNLIAYYIIGLPISFFTAFGLGWRLYGMWFGVSIGLALVSVVEYIYLFTTDWNRAAREAESRNNAG
ncbi:hypothetical protein Cpir12675_000650 [Ceratocystis pirilliformis]|uniref:Transporter n=1 Tax=Ceratocystis pirilliformis TaxID=259994 RepID=A0ABR3ZKC6_9PEZI